MGWGEPFITEKALGDTNRVLAALGTRQLATPLSAADVTRIARDCDDPRCTRIDGRCVGLHCPHCTEPCSTMGCGCQDEG
jgi:hypothetical protein